MNHILTSNQFTRKQIEELFELARKCQSWHEQTPSWELKGDPCLSGDGRPFFYMMGSLFLEPSLRTRFSFEAAHQRLGGSVITAADASSTSQSKGESLEDTVRAASQLVDVICLRSPIKGAAEAAASVSSVPIINCGDGSNEHPTQALLDLYTIGREIGRLDNLNVLFFGDDYVYTRTVRSLMQMLSLFDNNKVETELSYYQNHLPADSNWLKKLSECDVLYVTRRQKERWPQGRNVVDRKITVSFNELNLMKPKSVVLHPGPRNLEINPQIDNEPKLAMWRQVKNGMYVRMAILKTVLNHI